MRALTILGATVLLLPACARQEAPVAAGAPPATAWAPAAVAVLGRLEPEGGVLRVAAPSTPEAVAGAVVAELLVAQGDRVAAGQLLAVTDSGDVIEASLAEAEVEQEVAAHEADRRDQLARQEVVSAEVSDGAQGDTRARCRVRRRG